ncbi:MAG: hypothetical protein R3E83_22445 [Burkholderiaceae bacterium]
MIAPQRAPLRTVAQWVVARLATRLPRACAPSRVRARSIRPVQSIGLLLAALLLLSACEQKGPEGDGFFPLAGGHRWVYSATRHFEGTKSLTDELVIETRGPEEVVGEQAWKRRTNTGASYWLRADETGIYRVASRHALDLDRARDDPVHFVLKRPFEVGTEWRVATTSYMLERRNAVPRHVSTTHKRFPMDYRIAALDAVVEVPAGRYEGCIHVEGVAHIRVYVDAAFGWRQMPLTSNEWYCRDVGLVKLVRSEPSPSRFMIGGDYTIELLAHD